MGNRFERSTARAFFGTVTVSMPFLNVAFTALSSTSRSSVICRSACEESRVLKAPEHIIEETIHFSMQTQYGVKPIRAGRGATLTVAPRPRNMISNIHGGHLSKTTSQDVGHIEPRRP